MEVTDGNGTKLRAKFSIGENVKFAIGGASVVAVTVTVLNFFGMSPEGTAARERRQVQTEQATAENARQINALIETMRVDMQDDRVRNLAEGERMSAMEAHDRAQDRELDRIQDKLKGRGE